MLAIHKTRGGGEGTANIDKHYRQHCPSFPPLYGTGSKLGDSLLSRHYHDTTRLNMASIGPVVKEWEPSKFQLSALYIGQGSSIYTHVFENGAHVRTLTLIVFQEITQECSFNQPQTDCQHTAYSPTSLVSGWLASSH